MTHQCRRLAFLVLTLIVASRAPSAAQAGGGQSGGVPPVAQPAPGQPAGGQSGAPPQGTPPPTAEHAPPPAAVPVTTDRPPGPFALDVRIAMPSFNTGSALADPLGFRTDQLPGRGWGLLVGAHVYPLRRKRFALGLGADLVRTSGSQAPDPESDTADTDPTVETRFNALVPQLSLNFGTSRGPATDRCAARADRPARCRC